jgi:AcrR family transcriptional regulator
MTPPSSSPSVERGRSATRPDGERSRERILDAAEQLLTEGGYAGTGIAAISRASGLPASSIYWFFQGKQDLAAAVVERAADRWHEELALAVEAPRPPAEQMGAFLSAGVDLMAGETPLFLRLYLLLALECSDRDPDLLERLRVTRERSRLLFGEALKSLVAEAVSDDADSLAEELSHLFMALAQGAVIGHHLDPDRVQLECLAEDLPVAMRAIAEHRARKETP